MSVQKRGPGAWRVRWQQGDQWKSETYALKAKADARDREIKARKEDGTLPALNAGRETLDQYVRETWTPTHAALLAPKTRQTYSALYDGLISPVLGAVALREITPELIGKWQARCLTSGPRPRPVAVRQAVGLLGNILQRAFESGRIARNPVRLVRKVKLPRRAEIRPFAPVTVEAMRAAASPRDAMLIALMAYAGLRPGEALALRWTDVREKTILVERAISLGEVVSTKTGAHRTVRMLAPLAADLRSWRMRCGRPADHALIIPGKNGEPWTEAAFASWRKQAFKQALAAAGVDHARPYDCRHSFASLLLHEGRSVIYVARQLGHGAQLTLSTYGHVIDELEDSPHQDAETAIWAARESWAAPQLPIGSNGPA